MIRILAASALALVSITSLTTPALAETVKVGYTDLDLSNVAGQTALQHRVTLAITQVCGIGDPRDLAELAHVDACRKSAKAATMSQIAAISDPSQRSAMRNTSIQVASR